MPTKGEWIMAEGHEAPNGGIKRTSKERHHFSRQLRKGQICRDLGVDREELEKMIEAGEVVLV